MFKKILKKALILIAFFLSFCALFSAHWYITVFGNVGFRSILFTLFSPMQGTASGIVYDWLLKGLLPSCICTALLSLFYFLKIKIKNLFKNIICIILCLSCWTYGVWVVEIPGFVSGTISNTELYDKYYASPVNTKITFPKEKRNLIYIFLESMETTYFSQDLGGGLKENVIPELYDLAQNNINFSHSNGVGGWEAVTNTTWTSAAMVAQTSGVPLSIPLQYTIPDTDSNFLPKITTLTDILNQNGYYQTVMFGSVSSYGGRGNYFSQHGVDRIIDYSTAIEDGIIPKDYFTWWGMEDSKLIEYAKSELTKLSKQDKPFSFTMLTADTHHISGYMCNDCANEFDNQYKNVLSCSSKQVSEFVEWISKQPFYQNTTVVVIGDHLSMDAQFFRENMQEDYTRRVYNCFINSKAVAQNPKNRTFTPMDIFPTTLAALGCEIDGERLGLGTNLFSDKNTLAEEMTLQKLNKEINKSSSYYVENFIK